jgi:hypothetical protein
MRCLLFSFLYKDVILCVFIDCYQFNMIFSIQSDDVMTCFFCYLFTE